jgi:hypothetical protein
MPSGGVGAGFETYAGYMLPTMLLVAAIALTAIALPPRSARIRRGRSLSRE